MSEESMLIVKWNIENFSCWRKDFHENFFESPELSLLSENTFNAELYPCEDDGCTRIKIVDTDFDFSGDVSFICSDGSLIGTQRVEAEDDYDDSELLMGPKFEDIVERIKKNEQSFKDLLTVRFQFRGYPGFEVVTMFTTINVRRVSLKIDHKLIRSILAAEPKRIFRFKNLLLDIVLNEKFVGFMIKPDDNFEVDCLVNAHTSMVNSDNTVFRKDEVWHIFEEKGPWTFSKLMAKEIKERNITVIFRLEIVERETESFKYSKYCNGIRVGVASNDHNSPSSTFYENFAEMLAKDLMCLYQDQDHSDFTLKCGKASFPVHKAILSARSPVFKTMLSSGMKEEHSSEVVIQDLDTPTLARFLAFLYSGSVQDLQSDSALKLYDAADKYQVLTLKKECLDVLCADLRISNVCDVFSVADRHQDQELVKACRGFVLNNYNAVSQSKEWEGFIEREPLLGVKILTYFAANKSVVKNQSAE